MKIQFYSDYICHDCGVKYGTARDGVTTVHQNDCGVCGKNTGVCHQRNYGYPLENKELFEYTKIEKVLPIPNEGEKKQEIDD